MARTRRQLIAGNWKMNGLRADGAGAGTAVAALARRTGADCDLLVCPPATLLAAVAEALAGTASRSAARTATPSARARITGDIAAAMLRDAGATPRHRRPFRAARRPRRDRRRGPRQGRGRPGAPASLADRLRRRDRGRARGGRDAEVVLAASSRAACRPGAAAGWSSPTSRSGRSAPADADRGRCRRDARAHPRRAGAAVRRRGRGVPHALWRLGQGRRTPPSCSPWPMSTARWSAAPA